MSIYFIQHGAGGPIKVGTARNAAKRIKEIAVSCPEPIVVLGVIDGDHALEQRMHAHLLKHKHRGEWFRPSADVMAFVNRALNCARDEIDSILDGGAARRAAHFDSLDALGAVIPGAVSLGIALAIKASGLAAVAKAAGIPEKRMARLAAGTSVVTLTEFTALSDAFPEVAALFVILCASHEISPREVRANRATIEAARDALDDLLRKVVQAA